jgi:nucleoside-triphosphatase
MPENILISGRPGSGKTTLLMIVIEELAAAGFKAGGFVTEEIREGSGRVGFAVRDLWGEEAVLAHVDYKGKPRVGKYGIDLEAFESVALKALRESHNQADFFAIDEIGRMENKSSLFRTAVLRLMDDPLPLLATIPAVPDDFTARLIKRDDVTIYSVSAGDRDSLKEVILESVKRTLRFSKPEGGS